MANLTSDQKSMIERGVKLLGCRVRKITASSPLYLQGGEAVVVSIHRNGTVQLQCPCCNQDAGSYNPFELEGV